jgi:hypothetical protein
MKNMYFSKIKKNPQGFDGRHSKMKKRKNEYFLENRKMKETRKQE